MKVNINFDYDPVTKNVTNLKVTDLDISSVAGDLSKSLVTLKSTTLQLTQDIIDHLGLKANEKVILKITQSEDGMHTITLARTTTSSPSESSHRITQKLTISVRGNNLTTLSALSNQFTVKENGINSIQLTPKN